MEDSRKEAAPKFGTFLGVYTPSVLTILGLIMYLRLGWVVGNLGLGKTIMVVLISSAITFITGLSASAIATNIRIGVGGEYYMIAHSLGLEFGGAIGIPLYLCRTLSITFYSFGLAESISVLAGNWMGIASPHTVPVLAAIIIIIITALSGKSAELALKLQVPIMIAVALSIVALLVAALSSGFRSPEMESTYRTAPAGFWYVFAVFFPAVTGFTAGVGMSGDLRDSSRSIPRGTLLAVITGAIVYTMIPAVFSVTRSIGFGELAEPGVGAWTRVALFGPVLVFAGMWGAILSSAFGSALTGPRVLQALSEDGLAPRFLSRLSREGQPTIATWVTGILALASVFLGSLNAVAQFVTILFLTLYVIINFSAALEKLVQDPSYRPTINVPWYVSIFGSLGAIFVMFLLNPAACLAAVVIEGILYSILRRKALGKRWGDVRAGFWLSLSRFSLARLERHRIDPRNWRPNIIVFTDKIEKEIDMIYLAECFNQNRGVVTACQVVEGMLSREDINVREIESEMKRVLYENNIQAFCEANVAPDFVKGAIDIAQINGVGKLRANTVMFGWPRKKEKLVSVLSIMRTISRIGKSTLIARMKDLGHRWPRNRRIDIWWGGMENNGDLMLLLAHLLKLNRSWENSRIVLRSIVKNADQKEEMEANLSDIISTVRIKAEREVVSMGEVERIEDIIKSSSAMADIVFFGLMIPERGSEMEYARRLMELSDGLQSVIYVRNASEFSGKLL
ncbi:MAG: amino acid permease [Candidatus Latescibacteria bacterium]|nr:amino acid permease [bacterium]MBD3424512.1 amino acid permease [Candidatus Latescibacterota bacterium]